MITLVQRVQFTINEFEKDHCEMALEHVAIAVDIMLKDITEQK